MSESMKAMRLYAPRDLRMMEVPRPKIRPDEVLCRVRRACVCGTDYAIYSGELSFVKSGDVTFPMTLGHEWSGVVETVGGDVFDFHPGDRVISDNGFSCGRCLKCLAGKPHLCGRVRSLGTIRAWDGAFAEYLAVPERHLFHLPDGVDFDDGAMIEPLTIAYSGVRGIELEPGQTVLVNGAGSIGMLAARLCRIAGASRVFLTGRKPAKLEAARKFEAADVLIDTSRESVADVLARHTPKGKADKTLECSGSIDLLLQSLKLTGSGGTVAALAFYEREIESLPIDQLVFGNLTLRGIGNVSGTHEHCLALVAAGRIHPGALINGRYPFAELKQALEDMKLKNDFRVKWAIDFQN